VITAVAEHIARTGETAVQLPAALFRSARVRFILRRSAYAVVQLFVAAFVTFALLRLIPSNPAYAIVGPQAPRATVEAVTQRLGLNKSILEQFWIYLRDLVHGDMGSSWVTNVPVAHELWHRLPATLELIGASVLLSVLIGVPLGLLAAVRPRGRGMKAVLLYGLGVGAVPDFWLALMLMYLLFFKAGIAPAPLGQLDLSVASPRHITGMYVVDSLLTGNWAAFRSSAAHLVLPTLVYVLILTGAFVNMTRASVTEVLQSDFVRYEHICGIPRTWVWRRLLRNAALPIITLIASLATFMVGGAVLVETIFSWDGAGQYAVQAIRNSDLLAVQGFVLVAGIITIATYLALDLIYVLVDPRAATR
jgi:ABC-type dipeptide/oligopeptide/nickel transport system permease component